MENPILNPMESTSSVAPPSIDQAAQANEAPPGYIESLLMKIKNNLSLTISNLILKYVEEDIVLSLNVKQITARPCADENWEIGITESNEHDPGIHRIHIYFLRLLFFGPWFQNIK